MALRYLTHRSDLVDFALDRTRQAAARAGGDVASNVAAVIHAKRRNSSGFLETASQVEMTVQLPGTEPHTASPGLREDLRSLGTETVRVRVLGTYENTRTDRPGPVDVTVPLTRHREILAAINSFDVAFNCQATSRWDLKVRTIDGEPAAAFSAATTSIYWTDGPTRTEILRELVRLDIYPDVAARTLSPFPTALFEVTNALGVTDHGHLEAPLDTDVDEHIRLANILLGLAETIETPRQAMARIGIANLSRLAV